MGDHLELQNEACLIDLYNGGLILMVYQSVWGYFMPRG